MRRLPPIRKLLGAAMMIAGGLPLLLLLAVVTFVLLAQVPPAISGSAIALSGVVLAIGRWKRSRRFLLVAMIAAMALACWWLVFTWQNRNPLKQYGVSYEQTSGVHAEYQFIYFSWDRNGKRITGPDVIGEDLYVSSRIAIRKESR